MMIDDTDKLRYIIKDLTLEDMVNLIDALQLELRLHQLRYEHAADKGDLAYIQLNNKIEDSKRATLVKVHTAFRNQD